MIILGKKVKMSQIWKDETVVPVTVIKAEPNTISMIRTKERDGYQAVQLQNGRTKREFRMDDGVADMQEGALVDVSVFEEGDKVLVSGLSKGRGFQGVVKRHGFGGGPKTHGQKNRLRAPGSLGSTAPQRVVPGRKMAGRMGNERVTMKGLKVVQVNKEDNTILLRGAVPGGPNAIVEIRKVFKKK